MTKRGSTFVPCPICVSELLTYDDALEDYVCAKCGPKRCIVPSCIAPSVFGYIACQYHTCKDHHECRYLTPQAPHVIIINTTAHTTGLPIVTQAHLSLYWKKK